MEQRRPGSGVLHHSDRGSQYSSDDYLDKLRDRGFTISMSRKGDCWDNAPMESFFSTLKFQLGGCFSSRAAARAELFHYIEVFYHRLACTPRSETRVRLSSRRQCGGQARAANQLWKLTRPWKSTPDFHRRLDNAPRCQQLPQPLIRLRQWILTKCPGKRGKVINQSRASRLASNKEVFNSTFAHPCPRSSVESS